MQSGIGHLLAPNGTSCDEGNAYTVSDACGGEVCFDNLAGTTLVDPAIPALGGGFWYLSRGENDCGNGTYGTQSRGVLRVTTSCP